MFCGFKIICFYISVWNSDWTKVRIHHLCSYSLDCWIYLSHVYFFSVYLLRSTIFHLRWELVSLWHYHGCPSPVRSIGGFAMMQFLHAMHIASVISVNDPTTIYVVWLSRCFPPQCPLITAWFVNSFHWIQCLYQLFITHLRATNHSSNKSFLSTQFL